jgi:2-phospho-L-lactate guanylyltransferase
MRTAAIVPAKSFARAKSRLGDAVPDRAALAEAMLGDVLAALTRVRGLDLLIVVTGDLRATRIALEAGALVVPDRREAGQSAAVARGVAIALARGADRALLVPGDCPALSVHELEALLARHVPVVIVPDRHGEGTNALLLTPPHVIRPSFGRGSFARHCARAAGQYEICDAPSLHLDVDEPADLAALLAHPFGATRTRRLLVEGAAV